MHFVCIRLGNELCIRVLQGLLSGSLRFTTIAKKLVEAFLEMYQNPEVLLRILLRDVQCSGQD